MSAWTEWPDATRSCRRHVWLFGRRLFTVGGLRHQWDTDVMAIPDGTAFRRVNCVRCGFAVDGVRLRRAAKALPSMAKALGVER